MSKYPADCGKNSGDLRHETIRQYPSVGTPQPIVRIPAKS
jgi:hypothetical protein